MAAEKLRVLLIESDPLDAQRILERLRQGGYDLDCYRADSAESMRRVLLAEPLDLVLCRYNPPGFGGLPALGMLRQSRVALPFLFLSGKLAEATVLRAIRAGADDCIAKDELLRLLPAVERTLRDAGLRREHREAQLALQEQEMRLHAFICNFPGLAFQLVLGANGGMKFNYVSEGCQALLGVSHLELERDAGMVFSMLHEQDRLDFALSMKDSAQQLGFWNWEGRIRLQPSGEIKWVNLRCSPRLLANQDLLWEGVVFNITQSKLAREELDRSQAQLRELSLHIQDVREEERLNIAREVHDNLGSLLTAIKLDSAWLSGRLADQPKLLAKVRDIENVADRSIAAARNISRALRPSVLDCFGVFAAVEMEVGEFEQRTGIRCQLDAVDEGEPVHPDLAIALFRILQEALNNIIKHARASKVSVELLNRPEGISLTVTDNGCGLTEADRAKPRSFGLRGIAERVARFGGSLEMTPARRGGTVLTVTIPGVAAELKEGGHD